MSLLTTTVAHMHKANRVVVRPEAVPVTVEFAVNWGLVDGTVRVVETHSRLSNWQFIGRVVDGVLVLETVARTAVAYGQELDPEYGQVEFTRFDGPHKSEVRKGKGSSKLTIEVGPGGCEYAFIEAPHA